MTHLDSLRKLTLFVNMLEGQLPEDIDKLIRLESISIGSNRFSGPIPNSICNLGNLTLLDLLSNSFEGSIPHSVGNLTGISETSLSIPKKFALYQNYPNPFNPFTTIQYDLPKTSHIEIKIFNMAGQQIKTLVDANQSAGQQFIHWTGTDENGNQVATGVYFYRIKADEFSQTMKIVLLR